MNIGTFGLEGTADLYEVLNTPLVKPTVVSVSLEHCKNPRLRLTRLVAYTYTHSIGEILRGSRLAFG